MEQENILLIVIVTIVVIILLSFLYYFIKNFSSDIFSWTQSKKKTHTIVFDSSVSYNWSNFEKKIEEKVGFSLTGHGNLLNIPKTLELVFDIKKDVKINLDLEGKGRFLLNNGGIFHIKGDGSSFKVINGVAPHDDGETSNGGSIRQISGEIVIEGVIFETQKCEADFAGSVYMLDGKILLKDGVSGNPGILTVKNCRGLKLAGGGISIWMGKVVIDSDNGLVECVDCSTTHHAGGFINFYGEVILNGKFSKIKAENCKSGKVGSVFSYSGGMQFGENFPGYRDKYYPTLRFNGEFSSLEANGCESGSAAGMLLLRCNIYVNGDDNYITAKDNNIYKNDMITPYQRCTVVIRDCSFKNKDDLNVYTKENKCDDKEDCKDVCVTGNDAKIMVVKDAE